MHILEYYIDEKCVFKISICFLFRFLYFIVIYIYRWMCNLFIELKEIMYIYISNKITKQCRIVILKYSENIRKTINKLLDRVFY